MILTDKLDNEEKSPLDIILDPGNLYEGTDYITDVAIHILNRGGGTDEQKVKLLLGACFRGKMDLTKELVEHYNIDPKSALEGIHILQCIHCINDKLLFVACVASCSCIHQHPVCQ